MAIDSFIWFDHRGSSGMLEVAGETQDEFFRATDPKPAFEIKEWGFSVENKTTIGSATGGAGGGKAEFPAFTIKKLVDSASPNFFRNCVAGAHYKTVHLACRKAGADPNSAGKPYLLYTFGTVFTTKVEWAHDDDGPTESIEFMFGSLKVEYYIQSAEGTMATTPKMQGWSILTNKAL